MMTVFAIILWSLGTGSEVMQRIAMPIIGGRVVLSTILTLLVIPAIYSVVKGVGMA